MAHPTASARSDAPPAIELRQVTKAYARGAREVVAVRDLSLVVPRGEMLSLTGPSGSGKTTVLNLVAGLDRPSAGEVVIEGTTLGGLSEEALTRLRRTRVGVVFQFFNLLPSVPAVENVALPLRAGGLARRAAEARARAALEQVGLPDRADHRPHELSGGEMQRVAVARALAIDPSIILADEPTGNLDSFAGEGILRLLQRCSRERGVTIVLVTHSALAAAYGDRVVALHDGRITEDVVNRPAKPKPPPLRPVP